MNECVIRAGVSDVIVVGLPETRSTFTSFSVNLVLGGSTGLLATGGACDRLKAIKQ